MYMTVTSGGLGTISKALSPLRDLVTALHRAQGGELPDSNERRKLVRRVRSAGSAALPSLLRSFCARSEGEAALAYYLLRRLGGTRVVDAMNELLADTTVPDAPKGRALGLLSDLGYAAPNDVTLERPQDMLAHSVRELCLGLRSRTEVEETRRRILAEVAIADLPRFAFELERHGGASARPLLRALFDSPLPDDVRAAIAPLLGSGDAAAGAADTLDGAVLSEALDYLEAGRPRAARLRIERYLLQHPDDAEGHSALGAALLELGQRRLATRSFERALACEPTEPLHIWNLAVAARRARRNALAFATLSRYLDCFDRSDGALQRRTEARNYLASMQLRPSAWANADEAAEVLRVSDRLFTLGAAQLEANQPDQARELFEDVIELMPAHYPSWGNLGACFLLLGRSDEARRCFDHALAIEPSYETARSNRALLDRDPATPGRDDDDSDGDDAVVRPTHAW